MSSFFDFIMKIKKINAIMCIKLIKLNNLRRDRIMTKQEIINLLNIGENKEV